MSYTTVYIPFLNLKAHKTATFLYLVLEYQHLSRVTVLCGPCNFHKDTRSHCLCALRKPFNARVGVFTIVANVLFQAEVLKYNDS